MDGRVLVEALVDPAPVQFIDNENTDIYKEQSFDETEARQIEERLKGLGYL